LLFGPLCKPPRPVPPRHLSAQCNMGAEGKDGKEDEGDELGAAPEGAAPADAELGAGAAPADATQKDIAAWKAFNAVLTEQGEKPLAFHMFATAFVASNALASPPGKVTHTPTQPPAHTRSYAHPLQRQAKTGLTSVFKRIDPAPATKDGAGDPTLANKDLQALRTEGKNKGWTEKPVDGDEYDKMTLSFWGGTLQKLAKAATLCPSKHGEIEFTGDLDLFEVHTHTHTHEHTNMHTHTRTYTPQDDKFVTEAVLMTVTTKVCRACKVMVRVHTHTVHHPLTQTHTRSPRRCLTHSGIRKATCASLGPPTFGDPGRTTASCDKRRR
jgi:hypothetical protein